MTELIQIDDTWFMRKDGQEVALNPQPGFDQMRWNGSQWEIHMGYPFGHGVPVFNLGGYWQGKEYDTAVNTDVPK